MPFFKQGVFLQVDADFVPDIGLYNDVSTNMARFLVNPLLVWVTPHLDRLDRQQRMEFDILKRVVWYFEEGGVVL